MSTIRFKSNFWSCRDLLSRYQQLNLDPDYQREGSIWTINRQQLFIDSILNGIDSPKIYLHSIVPPEFNDDSLIRFAVIDGRQRLEAIVGFEADEFPLSENFQLLSELSDDTDEIGSLGESSSSRFQGMRYSELVRVAPYLVRRFLAYEIAMVTVETDDLGIIEELFFRLNEGTPLNAAEKRNRGTLLRGVLQKLTEHDAFQSFKILDRRGRFSDLALRFLYFESSEVRLGKVPPMRIVDLDRFAQSFRPDVGQNFSREEESSVRESLSDLASLVNHRLDVIAEAFQPKDHLLARAWDILTIYVMIDMDEGLATISDLRERVEDFFGRIRLLRSVDERDLSEDEWSVVDNFGDIQGTTTGSYLAGRANVLLRFVRGELGLRSASEVD